MNHDQWPGPTSRADLELRRERTGIYLRDTASPLEWGIQVSAEGQEGSAKHHAFRVTGDEYTSASSSGRPIVTAPGGFSYRGLTPSPYSWVLQPKIALLGPWHRHGFEHPDIAANPSKWVDWAAAAAEAPGQYAAFLPAIARILGTDNSDALVARSTLATWIGEAGDTAAARDQYAALLPEAERALGTDHPATVSIRANLARWTGESGDAAAARDQYAALLPEVQRVFGARHPGTFVVRNNHAAWTGEAGNATRARDEFAALLPDVEQALGPDHVDTLVVQHNLSSLWREGILRYGQVTEWGPSAPRTGAGGEGGDVAGPDVTGLPPAGRYLLGTFPDTVRPGKEFSVLISVVRSNGAPLKPFYIPESGRLIALIIIAPGLRVRGDDRQTVLVPFSGDSEPVKFDLVADEAGPRRISVTAWDGGTYLGELSVEVSVERDGPARPYRAAASQVREDPTDGEVTLLVRYDPDQGTYRFEFIDVDYPDEVTSSLVYPPGPRVERLIRNLNALAEGTAGYSAAETRLYLVNEGVTLWQELIPEKLRYQFWERQRRITQLTILTNQDVVPWELLYPKDPRRDAGFLVEQFPVTRAIYGRAQQRRLWLQPARFVIPPGSPDHAKGEAQALARLLGTRLTAISDLTPLVQLISKGRFGLLHFACHNRFDPDDGSSIRLDSPFTPTFLATAASDQTLARTAPVVFINACRSAGHVPSYNKLDGWAEKFLRAGAAAFIGTLWEVSDGMAREFAQELYRRLVDGDPLGKAVMAARQAVAAEPGDPTWLAYAVYGDPQARIDVTPKAR